MPGMLVSPQPGVRWEYARSRLATHSHREDGCFPLEEGEAVPEEYHRDVWIGISYSGRTTSGLSVYVNDTSIPDLSDPATLGCLLVLVREAWGEPQLCTHYHRADKPAPDGGTGWHTLDSEHMTMPLVGWHASEAEVLVAALAAAGGPR